MKLRSNCEASPQTGSVCYEIIHAQVGPRFIFTFVAGNLLISFLYIEKLQIWVRKKTAW